MKSELIQDPTSSLNLKERLRAIIVLLRPHQYYKNLLVFFGIFFSKNLFRVDLWLPILLAFIALCIVSSLNYLINDFRDREKDRIHPEKKNRPFPSGRISTIQGIAIFLILLVLLIILILIIPLRPVEKAIYLYPSIQESEILEPGIVINESKIAFVLVLGALFVTSQIYSLFLKKIVFADIVTISVNYVWRAIAGAVLITVSVSPWLIILCFITAMLLSLAKRKGDMALLGEYARQHKLVFELYTQALLDQSLATISAIEILAFFIYLIDRHPNETVFIVAALPLFTFIIFRFLFLISGKDVISRKAERLFLDKQLMFAAVIILLLFFVTIYFPDFLDRLLGIPDPKL
ncbi:MAG: UbiA prenyltransferase family protein [Candidatus Hodarchaeota archaeon]